MSTKRKVKHKSAVCPDTKPNNGAAEVFVLPPNLLEKLGINLNKIAPTENCPTELNLITEWAGRHVSSKQPIVEEYSETKSVNKKNESSILETASLMKESVFLSPTFVPTVANVIPGEVEIARPYEQSIRREAYPQNQTENFMSIPIHASPKHNGISCSNFDTMNRFQSSIFEKNNVNNINKCKDITIDNDCTIPETLTNNAVGQLLASESTNDSKYVKDMVKKSPDSLLVNSDENNYSENSNSNSNFDHEVIIPKKKKIKVINEEVLDVSKLYKHKSLNPILNNNVLTSVSVDMLLPIATINNNTYGANNIQELNSNDNSLIHLGISDTDVRQVDVVEHVNVLYVDNEGDIFNEINLMDEITNASNLIGNDFSKVDRLDNVIVGDSLNLITEGDITENLHDFPIITGVAKTDVIINNENHIQISANIACNKPNDDLITSEANCVSENLSVIEVCSKVPSSESLDLESSMNIVSPKLKSKRYLIDKNDLCNTDNTENVFVTEQAYKNKCLPRTSSSENNEKEIDKSKTGSRKSKLSIQGVEKPGGEIENRNLPYNIQKLKTYGNKRVNEPNSKHGIKNQKQSPNELPDSNQFTVKNRETMKTYTRNKTIPKIISDFTDHVQLNKDVNKSYQCESPSINLDVVRKSDDFCLCNDFGQLKYYDYDGSYEHIHFWKHRDVTSDRDLVFSMYNVDTVYNYDDIETSLESITESSDDWADKICWNEIYGDVNCNRNTTIYGKKCSNENQGNVAIPSEPMQVTSKHDNIEANVINCKLESQAINVSNVDQLSVDSSEPTGENIEKIKEIKEISDTICKTYLKNTDTQRQELNKTDVTSEPELKDMGEILILDMTVKGRKKRKISVAKEECSKDINEPPCKKDVKCGVCQQILAEVEWEQHSSKQHGLIAWKDGHTFDFQNNDLLLKLKQKLEKDGVLKCGFCNTEINKCKQYINHVKECLKPKPSKDPSESDDKKVNLRKSLTDKTSNSKNLVNCGVCKQDINETDWILHICQNHNYLAWKSGEPPLNLDAEDVIEKYLYNIIKNHGPIICSKCGFDRKYGFKSIKTFLKHIKTCNKADDICVEDSTKIWEVPIVEESSSKGVDIDSFKCGVCPENVTNLTWIDHLAKEHNYLAWKEGEEPLDLKNEEQVWKHLYDLSKKLDGLECAKCGIKRKYVKKYLKHIEECDGAPCNEESLLSSPIQTSQKTVKEIDDKDLICGNCSETVKACDWFEHIGKEHNYMAWKEGEEPLDLEDEEQVWKHLYDLSKKLDGLICAKCGIKRKYVKKYLKHIEECDGAATVDESLLSSSIQPSETIVKEEDDKEIICAICSTPVKSCDWYEHIGKQHNYIAWKEGEEPLDADDDDKVWKHLYTLSKECDGLICFKCGLKRKYVKKYLDHIETCDGTGNELSMSMNESRSSAATKASNINEGTKCGICQKNVKSCDWFNHIRKQHSYIAWRDGEQPLELKDEGVLEDHLHNIMKEYGRLSCPKCGLDHKYEVSSVKLYQAHVDTCTEIAIPESDEDSKLSSIKKIVKCRVCEQDIDNKLWIKHIESEHNYLAWKDEETPLDLEDKESIRLYLFTIINEIKALKCSKCGVQKKYPKNFIMHIESCNKTVAGDSIIEEKTDMCVCAVCSATVRIQVWKDHAMAKHYNLAWKVGDDPIDLRAPKITEKYLKEYKQKYGKLVCKLCKASRASLLGFYAHILACGKTEEELEEFQNVCEICNNKYLCIYKTQHLAYHKEQQYAKERKLQAEKEGEPVEEVPLGRRRAAMKANDVIEKLKTSNNFKHTCDICGFGTDCEKILARHKCTPGTFEQHSETSEESEDTDGLGISEEEDNQDANRRRKHKECIVQAKIPNIPFKFNEPSSYTAQSKEDFFNIHYTSETLFPQWSSSDFELLSDEQISEYLPAVETSCKIKTTEEWGTFRRFEAKPMFNGYCCFVGASIQCISWVPPHADDRGKNNNYLSVACHRGSDVPRYNFDELGDHPGLIQLWDFDDFHADPKLMMGIAHDYGTVWAMDWCPSGTRDIPTDEDKNCARLGLLAVACSNGIVYILSVPYPSTIAESLPYVKLKAVAELRLSAIGSDRKVYQATAVSWSKQKGHAFVAVGYSDGTTAFYDIKNSSPLLQYTENKVTVFYPYNDIREHNVCVTDMDTLALGADEAGSGAVVSASLGGAAAALRPAAPLARLTSHFCTLRCRFAPGLPSAMIAVDDSSASQVMTEMDWYACGRKLGPMRMVCGCARCGRVLLYAPPMLRTLRALPPYADLRKQNYMRIKMLPLSKKRKKVNDELSMLLEPLTYDNVVEKYGIEITMVEPCDKNTSINTMKEQWSERFPLADVTAMAFCPSEAHHNRAAVSIHSGFIVLIAM